MGPFNPNISLPLCRWTPETKGRPPELLPLCLSPLNQTDYPERCRTALNLPAPVPQVPQRKAASQKRIKTGLFRSWRAPAGRSPRRHFGSASLSCWQSHWHQRHFSRTEQPLSAPRLPARPNHSVWTTHCLAGWLDASHAPVSHNKQEVKHRPWPHRGESRFHWMESCQISVCVKKKKEEVWLDVCKWGAHAHTQPVSLRTRSRSYCCETVEHYSRMHAHVLPPRPFWSWEQPLKLRLTDGRVRPWGRGASWGFKMFWQIT